MKFILILVILMLNANLIAQTKENTKTKKVENGSSENLKKQQDIISIKSMCGIFKVSFDFAETFSPDTAYKYHDRYRESGIEYVFIAEESEKKIVLQHILIANDTMIIKHWRQDWIFENRDIYQFYKENEWTKKTISIEQAKGTWTQKVYQVDDSPRYESYGTWIHVDGKHFWEGVNDSPLPRREFSKRSDYNVMRRHSRIEIFQDGWVLSQDNEKIVRNNGIDKLICWEKGIERFTTGNYDSTPALKWWSKQATYWEDVRNVWAEVFAVHPNLKLEKRINNKMLFEVLFELGDSYCEKSKYIQGTAIKEINAVIRSYIKSN